MDDHDPSPFSQYFNTNYAPSDSEVAFLKRLVRDREADVVALADRIKEAERGLATQRGEAAGALSDMERKLVVHRQFIKEHTMLLSPIRRIPLDVLTLLFQTFIEAAEEPMGPNVWPYFPSIAAPCSTTISQVCASWRRLALQTPTLWTHIHIPHLDPDEMSWVKWCNMMEAQRLQVETWIDRSSSRPIDLGLRIGRVRNEHGAGAEKRYEALVETLLPTCHRWQSLNFNWDGQDTTECVLKLFDGPQFPLLRKARIFIENDNMRRSTQRGRVIDLSRSALFAAPALRDVTLAGFWPNMSGVKASSTSPLYDSITHLAFEASPFWGWFDCREALHVLKSLPNLISVQINLKASGSPLQPWSPPVHAPHLTSLELKSRPVCEGFGPSLYLPRLESLHLNCPTALGPVNGQEELLLQYGARLRELTLCHDTLAKESLPRCLEVLVNITVLNLYAMPLRSSRDSKPDMHLLSQLSIPGVLPRLEELELHNIANQGDGLLENAVLDFLAQRVQCAAESGGGRNGGVIERAALLSRVQIRFAFPQRVDIVRALRTRGVSLDGIDVALEYSTSPMV